MPTFPQPLAVLRVNSSSFYYFTPENETDHFTFILTFLDWHCSDISQLSRFEPECIQIPSLFHFRSSKNRLCSMSNEFQQRLQSTFWHTKISRGRWPSRLTEMTPFKTSNLFTFYRNLCLSYLRHQIYYWIAPQADEQIWLFSNISNLFNVSHWNISKIPESHK